MTEEKPKHSPLEQIRPELRDLVTSILGRTDPNSASGQNLIATVYTYMLDYGRLESDDYRALAGEAATFQEEAMRLAPLHDSRGLPLREIYRERSRSLYEKAGNLEKVRELSTGTSDSGETPKT